MPYPVRRRRSSTTETRTVRSKTSSRPHRKSYMSKFTRGKKGLGKAIKKVVLQTAESKWRSTDIPANSAYDAAFGGYALNHNSVVEMQLVNNQSPAATNITYLARGTSEQEREGNELYGVGIMLRASIAVPTDRKNARFRIMLLEYNTVQGDPTQYNQFFHNITGRNCLDPIRNDQWSPKVLGTYYYRGRDTSSDPIDGQRGNIIIKKWIPWRRKITYATNSDFVVAKGMKERLAVIVTTWDNNSTLGTSTCGYIRMNATLHFKDP